MTTRKALIFVAAAFVLWKAAAKYMSPVKQTEKINPVTVDSNGASMGATN
jgi:hypothetical protein